MRSGSTTSARIELEGNGRMLTMRLIGAALLAMMFLTGCARVITDCPAPTPIPAEVQRQAANEVDALPPESALVVVLAAALDDRDKLRACRAIR